MISRKHVRKIEINVLLFIFWIVFVNDHVFHEQEHTQLLKSVNNSLSLPVATDCQTSTRGVDFIPGQIVFRVTLY